MKAWCTSSRIPPISYVRLACCGLGIELAATYRANFRLSIDGNNAIKYGVHVKNSGLSKVDNGCAEIGTEYARVADGKITALEMIKSEFAIACLNIVSSIFFRIEMPWTASQLPAHLGC